MSLPRLRDWQARAISQFVNGAIRGLKDQLAYVTPGGGKTRFALEVAGQLIDADEVRRVVIVVHTHNLRDQWIEDAAEFGLVLTDVIERSAGANGFVVTYQQLVEDDTRQRVRKVVSGKNQTLVIPDECHHMADGRNWGENCRDAFGRCHRRILLSGTPVRADDCTIPFVTYRKGVAVADFTYGYSEALSDGVVPPVFFPTFSGKATWKLGDEEITSDGSGLNGVDQTRRLNTMIDSANWLRSAFVAADKRLTELRVHQNDAAGLIVCRDQSHAQRVCRLAQQQTTEVKLAISDDSSAHQTISDFKAGNGRWLVTVRMVSEGIDIQRLRVGLYATNYRAELFFRQVVGRFVRIVPGLVDQSAFLYLPDHPDLIRFAREMSEDRIHVLSESKPANGQKRTAAANAGAGFVGGIAEALEGVTVLPGSEFSEAELLAADNVRSAAGLGYLPLEVVASLLRASQSTASLKT